MTGGIMINGDQVLVLLAVCLAVLAVAVAGRVLLAAAVIACIQWLVIHYLASNNHAGVGGARGARAAGGLHPGRRADRLDRARLHLPQASRRWSAMSTDNIPDDIPDDATNGAGCRGTRCRAGQATVRRGRDPTPTPGSTGRQRAPRAAGAARQSCGSDTKSGGSDPPPVCGRCCAGWCATACCIR